MGIKLGLGKEINLTTTCGVTGSTTTALDFQRMVYGF